MGSPSSFSNEGRTVLKTIAIVLAISLLIAPGLTFSQVSDSGFKAPTSNVPGAEYPQINSERRAKFRLSAPRAEKWNSISADVIP
jgi:hypothetical protein